MAYKASSSGVRGGHLARRLRRWLESDKPKTVASLSAVFAEKTIGIVILVVMLFPALPLPTGGISHVLEVIAMLVALQLMVGWRGFWLPIALANREMHVPKHNSTIGRAIRTLAWLESHSRPRLSSLMQSRAGRQLIGLFIFLYSLVAFMAPPFSGLDTFPSIGVEIIALALVLDDAALFAAGVLAGAIGSAIVVGAGTLVLSGIRLLL